jgi:hypothetical protein
LLAGVDLSYSSKLLVDLGGGKGHGLLGLAGLSACTCDTWFWIPSAGEQNGARILHCRYARPPLIADAKGGPPPHAS